MKGRVGTPEWTGESTFLCLILTSRRVRGLKSTLLGKKADSPAGKIEFKLHNICKIDKNSVSIPVRVSEGRLGTKNSVIEPSHAAVGVEMSFGFLSL